MRKAALFGMMAMTGLAVSASCDDDETTNPTTSTASSMGGDGGTAGEAGMGGMGGIGGQCPGTGGACIAFGDDCDPDCDTCCEEMGQPGVCHGFMMGNLDKCTIECQGDGDCPTNHCNNMGYCDYN